MVEESIQKPHKENDIYKAEHFSNKILLVNGWEGSGKTCISSVLKSISNSEVMRYSYEFEWICYLWLANKVDSNSASVVLRSISDLLIYNHMQSREVNFRPDDLSSIFKSPIWYKYIYRLFSAGGVEAEKRINKNTVLHLVTHKLYECRNLIKNAFGARLIHIEVIRDPIYMLKQTKFNQDTLHTKQSPRDFSFRYHKNKLPVYDGLEASDKDKSNKWELAVRFLNRRFNYYFESTNSIIDESIESPYIIFFEDFVKDPKANINKLRIRYNLEFEKSLKKYLKAEKIPRDHHSDSRARQIYKKIGWVKLNKIKNSINDIDSYIDHYQKIGVKKTAINDLLELSEKYRAWKERIYNKI